MNCTCGSAGVTSALVVFYSCCHPTGGGRRVLLNTPVIMTTLFGYRIAIARLRSKSGCRIGRFT